MTLRLTIAEEKTVKGHSGKIPTNRGGRPTDYRPEFAEQGRKFSLLGANNDRIAELLGVATSTFDLWLHDIDEFREAIFDGRARADAVVAESFYRRAVGYDIKITRREISRSVGADGKEAGETQTKVTETTQHIPADVGAAEKWLRWRGHMQLPDERPLTLGDILAIADAARAEEARRIFDPSEFGQIADRGGSAARPN